MMSKGEYNRKNENILFLLYFKITIVVISSQMFVVTGSEGVSIPTPTPTPHTHNAREALRATVPHILGTCIILLSAPLSSAAIDTDIPFIGEI